GGGGGGGEGGAVQGEEQVARRLEAPAGVAGHQLCQDRVQRRRGRDPVARRLEPAEVLLLGDLQVVLAGERHPAGQQVVERRPQGEQVAAAVHETGVE